MTKISNQNILQIFAYSVIIVIGVGWLLKIGSSLIIPFIFAVFLAVFLYPLERKIGKFINWKSISVLLSFVALFIPFILITTLFSLQLMTIMESLSSIEKSLTQGIDKVFSVVNEMVPFLNLDSESVMKNGEGEGQDLSGPLKFIGQGLMSTTSILASVGMTLLYSFLLLYYRKSINNFILYQAEKSSRSDFKVTLNKIKETIQSYIGGLGLVVVILSVLNSIGLTLIGIDHAIFWGTLAGILAIIPFIGTLVGGVLPFIYALASTDTNWQPIAVVAYYLVIQQIEGNFITPKIVGDKVDINPLFAIISLVFFGSFWGVAGVVLALPIISIIKIILSNFDNTLSYAALMSSDIKSNKGIFKKIASMKE